MKWIRRILYENGELSTTRLLAAAGFVLFVGVSIYLVWRGQTWGNYETFATVTGGGASALQAANKFINSRFNSEDGKPFIKEGGNHESGN